MLLPSVTKVINANHLPVECRTNRYEDGGGCANEGNSRLPNDSISASLLDTVTITMWASTFIPHPTWHV